jgi:uncharacterized membrane protein
MKKSEREVTLVKLIWIFIIGSIAGYIIETSFYMIKHGVFMNKQGLLYGPFKPIYGVGAVLLSIILNMLKGKNNWLIFFFGSIIGGVFEYICSIVLEYVFGTRMWSYANMGMNINGRVFIPYLPIWGIISLLYLKVLYPGFNKVYLKVPKKLLYFLTIIVSIFMVYDILISSFAVMRMSERAHNVPSSNKF